MLISTNFLVVLLLAGFLVAPFYFATKVAKPSQVAGVKTDKNYFLTSQIDKFPNLQYLQSGQSHKVSYSKLSASQAFLGVFILTNPSPRTVTYQISKIQGSADVFFGQDLNEKSVKITLPSSSSIPVSIHSTDSAKLEFETVEFTVTSI